MRRNNWMASTSVETVYDTLLTTSKLVKSVSTLLKSWAGDTAADLHGGLNARIKNPQETMDDVILFVCRLLNCSVKFHVEWNSTRLSFPVDYFFLFPFSFVVLKCAPFSPCFCFLSPSFPFSFLTSWRAFVNVWKRSRWQVHSTNNRGGRIRQCV